MPPAATPDPTPSDLRWLAGPLEGERVRVGDLHLDVHVAGPDDGEVVLLVAGLGMQRTAWPPELLAALHAAGRRTVAVDNRDTGRSSVLPGGLAGVERTPQGVPVAVYTLRELAADLVQVLDHLEVSRAHVVGVSMGGMIAQRIALGWPQRVASLHLLMTTTGDWRVGLPDPEARWVLTREPAPDLEAHVDAELAATEAVGSPGRVDAARVRALARAHWQRGVHPEGTARQLAAILADGDRTAELATLSAPTLVVHGAADRLIDVSGGRALAGAIPGARYLELPELGHDLPPDLLEVIVPELLATMTAGRAPAP